MLTITFQIIEVRLLLLFIPALAFDDVAGWQNGKDRGDDEKSRQPIILLNCLRSSFSAPWPWDLGSKSLALESVPSIHSILSSICLSSFSLPLLLVVDQAMAFC